MSSSQQPPVVDTTDQAPGLYVLFTIFTLLPLVCVSLRVYARRKARLPLWWDDWLLVLSVPVIIAQYVFLLITIQNGMGKHIEVVPPGDIQAYLMWTYASELYYPFIITFIKASILCLYIRLFGIKVGFARTCYALLVFVVAWGVSTLFSTIFQCSPVAAAWNKEILETDPTATCIDLRSWLIGTNVPNISVDAVIILLPVPLLWNLRLSWPRRLGLCAVFLLAFTTTVISILRVIANANIDVEDPTWSFTPIAEFSTVEGNVGVSIACLPILAPLLRIFRAHPSEANSGVLGGSGTTGKALRSGDSKSRMTTRPSVNHSQGFSQLGEDDEANHLVLPAGHTSTIGTATPLGVRYAKEGTEGGKGGAAMQLDTINVQNDIYVSRH